MLSPENLHVRAISERTRLPYSVVQREVDRLESSGLIASSRFATSRVLRPVEHHPFFHELRALLLKAYGPQEVLAELLRPVEGIREAHIFGSWAARYAGDWGAPPADLDVAVVGTPLMTQIDEVEAKAEDLLGQHVQLHVIPPEEWDAPTYGFVRTVHGRELVPLLMDGA